MKDYSKLNSHSDSIMILIMDAYDKGYEDGKKALCGCTYNMEDEYNHGLNDGWEAARKLALSSLEGGFDTDTIAEIFDGLTYYPVLKDVSASEAIAKIKEYEKKRKQESEIKVGDEVRLIGSDPETDDCDYGVCTNVKKDKIYVMRKDGSACEETKIEWYKTGRHFDQMAGVLAEMRGDKE